MTARILLTTILALALTTLAPAAESAEESLLEGRPAFPTLQDADDLRLTRPTRGLAREAIQGEVEPPRRVTLFIDRESTHESVLRLMQLRRSQAREQGETFWENYVVNGPEDTIGKPVSVHAEDETLRAVLEEVARTAGIRFEMTPRVDRRRVSIEVEELPLHKVLNLIGRRSDTVVIHDRFAESYIVVDLRDPEPVTEVEDLAIPLRFSDPADFLAFIRELGFEATDGTVAVNPAGEGFLYTGGVASARELRLFVREYDRRPPPEGESYTHEVIELKHQSPRGILTELRRTFHGNFGMRGDSRLGIVVTPRELDAVRRRVAEYDQPGGEG